MSTAEILKMTELLVATNEKLSDLHTTVALNNQKTETALKQIDDKVDDVKEDVGAVNEVVGALKIQIEIYQNRLAVLENKTSVFDKFGSVCKSVFSFAKSALSMLVKFKTAVLIIVGLVAIFFGRPLGLDAQATIALLIQLFS